MDSRNSPALNHALNIGKNSTTAAAAAISTTQPTFNFNSNFNNEQIYLNENGKRKSPENNHHKKIANDLNIVPPPSKRSALSPLRLSSNTPNLSPSPTLSNHAAVIISPIPTPHNSVIFGNNINNQLKLEDMTFLRELKEKEKHLNNCKFLFIYF